MKRRGTRQVKLSPEEQSALTSLYLADGTPGGGPVSRWLQVAPATGLGAALGLPARPATAALLRQGLKRWARERDRKSVEPPLDAIPNEAAS